MTAKKIKILIKSDGSYLDTILPPITANEDGRTIVQVIAPFPITDIVSVNYSIRPIQATVKGSYLLPTGKFGKDVLDEDYTHFQTVADWNVFEIPINAVALEYISKYRAGLVLVSFAITQLQTPYFATNYLGLFSDTNPIPTTTYNDGDYFIANEYNFTAHDITWAKGDYAYFYNGKWNKGKSVLKASTPSIELPVDPSLKDAPQLEYDEDVALLLANDLGLLTQRVSQSETDIESAENDINEIDGRVGVNETDIDNLQFDVLENTGDIADLQSTKVPKTTTIIGLDLQDNILLTEFKTALGNATQSVAGLLSAEDKTHLDGLVALLESSDGNNVVDTIGEILAIFNNYPEGADLVTALNGKVDKVAGKGLSQNDLTDILKANLLSAYAHSQVVNSNPHKTTYQQLLNKPTTIEQLGVTNVYNKQYIDALKDKNGWESELLGTLSNNETIDLSVINQYDEIQMYAKDTLGVIDNENIRPSLMQSGDSVYFFDDTQAFIMVDTVFGFYAPVGYTLQVIGLKYTELKASDTTYDNTASEMTATTVQGAIDELDTQVELKVSTSDIVDNLESTDINKPLSANQGRTLQNTTAKLAVSNVFTQPQQVPNATLPQHTTNKLQVETMFEMFKQQLRGYNLPPDLTGKEYLDNGVYRLYDNRGITLDYNIFNGEYKINGTATGYVNINLFDVLPNTEYTVSYIAISGTITSGSLFIYVSTPNIQVIQQFNENINKQNTFITTTQTIFRIDTSTDRTFDNYTFKLQLEKGSTATPYTVPGQIPQYKIVGEE